MANFKQFGFLMDLMSKVKIFYITVVKYKLLNIQNN